MKFILKAFIIAVVFVVAWNYAKKNPGNEPLVSLRDKSGNFSLTIREPEKDRIKGVAKRISDLVYREATLHNPPGDMIPDQVDNKVIREVKEKVN